MTFSLFILPLSNCRYEAWLAGEDFGRHPEEANAKPTAAPPPSVDEYLDSGAPDRLVPQCMLEQRPKKEARRHPVHKDAKKPRTSLELGADADEGKDVDAEAKGTAETK